MTRIFKRSMVAWQEQEKRMLSRRGRLAITLQPRWSGAQDEDAITAGQTIVQLMRKSSFADIRTYRLPIRPVQAVCVVGQVTPTSAHARVMHACEA